jgi:1,4-dihydroxy-2-naphthoate octaprenyltransferase
VVFLAGTYLAIIFGYISGSLPLAGFLALGSIIIAVPTVRGVARFAEDMDRLIPYMARNVVIIILTPVLLAVGLFISS